MSDGSLSQEEIDALLQGADDLGAAVESGAGTPAGPAAPTSGGLTGDEINELKEIFTEVAQIMGTTLSTITGKQVSITSPSVEYISGGDYISQLTGVNVQVKADFTGGAPGFHSFVISEEVAKKIAAMMMAQEEGELTDMALSALNEAFSQMAGASLNVVEEKTGVKLSTGSINAVKKDNPSEIEIPQEGAVRVRYQFSSEGFQSILDEILAVSVAKSLSSGSLQKRGVSQGDQAFSPGFQAANVYTGQPAPQPQQQTGTVGVQPVQFAPLNPAEQPSGVPGNIGLLMDVSMQLTVELGRTKMLIKDILAMGEGTIVELDKLAGEPVDLLVNGKLIAKGEVVVIDENFGVRVTDIISPMERISNLE